MTEKAQPGNVFLRSQARILLKQRYILFLGDSVQRGMYKDLVALVHDGHLMGDAEKRAKGEQCYRGDYCLNISELTNQTNFTEVREYRGYAPLTHEERTLFGQRNWNWSNSILIRFGFITRAYNEYVEQLLNVLTEDHFPDVICINSTFWDISRWEEVRPSKDKNGFNYYPTFQRKVEQLCQFIHGKEMDAIHRGILLQPCLKIWRTSMPIAAETKGGVLEGTGENNSAMYREDIARCNLNLIPIMNENNWDVLDANFWFRNCQNEFRENDGIHWTAHAHRWLTNIFLSHLAEAWGLGWPTYPKRDPSSKTFKGVNLSELFTIESEMDKLNELKAPDDIVAAERVDAFQ